MKKYETQKQLADLEEKRRILMARINQWCQVQLAYIPAVGPLVANVTSQLLSVEFIDRIRACTICRVFVSMVILSIFMLHGI